MGKSLSISVVDRRVFPYIIVVPIFHEKSSLNKGGGWGADLTFTQWLCNRRVFIGTTMI